MSVALKGTYPLAESTACSPSLAVLDDLVFLAWKGEGNQRFSILISNDGGRSFRHKYTTSEEQTDKSVAIASHDGKIYIAWKGVDGRGLLNVAQLALETDENGETYIAKLTGKKTLSQISIVEKPALVSHEGHLWVAFKRTERGCFSMGCFDPGFASISSLFTRRDGQGDGQPSLISHNGHLVAVWRGLANSVIQVARMDIQQAESAGSRPVLNAFAGHSLKEASWKTPAMASAPEAGGLLYLGWGGASREAWMHLSVSTDNGERFIAPNRMGHSTQAGVAMAWVKDHLIVVWSAGNQFNGHRIFIARTAKVPSPPPGLNGLAEMLAKSETEMRSEVGSEMGSEISSGMQTPRTSTCGEEWVMD